LEREVRGLQLKPQMLGEKAGDVTHHAEELRACGYLQARTDISWRHLALSETSHVFHKEELIGLAWSRRLAMPS